MSTEEFARLDYLTSRIEELGILIQRLVAPKSAATLRVSSLTPCALDILHREGGAVLYTNHYVVMYLPEGSVIHEPFDVEMPSSERLVITFNTEDPFLDGGWVFGSHDAEEKWLQKHPIKRENTKTQGIWCRS